MLTSSVKTISTSESDGVELPSPIYFLSLTVENVRCFGLKQTLDLSDGNSRPKQWTILIGDNGVGKTTLLQCLAGLQSTEGSLASDGRAILIPRLHRLNFDGYFMANFFVGRTNDMSFHIHADLSVNAALTSQNRESKIARWSVKGQSRITSSTFTTESGNGLICYGYSASRRVGTTDLSGMQTADTILSLFDDNATLINAEEWLLQADYAAKSLVGAEQKRAEKRRNRIKDVLIRLLPDVSDLRFAPSRTTQLRTTVQAQTPCGWVPIKERNRLLSKARLTAKDKARLQELEAEIGSLPTGETPQDLEAMDIIRRAAELLKKQK